MDKEPIISIIIPIYNMENYIRNCLKSVQHQTYKNFEALLVDDGSTDNSAIICNSFCNVDKRFKYFYKKNGGLSDARNLGIENAKGELITFIDSDDKVLPCYLEHLVNPFLNNGLCDLSVCSVEYSYSNIENNVKQIFSDRNYTGTDAFIEMCYSRGLECYAWGKLYKKHLFDKIKFSVGRYFEDIDIMYKILLSCKCVHVNCFCDYLYTQREGSITSEKFSNKHFILFNIMNEMRDFAMGLDTGFSNAIARRRTYSDFWLLVHSMANGSKYKKFEDLVCKDLRQNGTTVLKDKNSSCKDKMKMFVFLLSGRKGYYLFYRMIHK